MQADFRPALRVWLWSLVQKPFKSLAVISLAIGRSVWRSRVVASQPLWVPLTSQPFMDYGTSRVPSQVLIQHDRDSNIRIIIANTNTQFFSLSKLVQRFWSSEQRSKQIPFWEGLNLCSGCQDQDNCRRIFQVKGWFPVTWGFWKVRSIRVFLRLYLLQRVNIVR